MTTHSWRAAAVRRLRTALSDPDRGYNVIEAVIVVPIIIIFTLVVVQFALLWHGRHVAEAAAQAAARSAAGYSATAATGQADGVSYLAQVAPNLLRAPVVTVDRTPLRVQVTVRAQVLSIIPFGSFSVSQAAAVPVETFVAGR
jgi:Flp pilus assembly protein TadG